MMKLFSHIVFITLFLSCPITWISSSIASDPEQSPPVGLNRDAILDLLVSRDAAPIRKVLEMPDVYKAMPFNPEKNNTFWRTALSIWKSHCRIRDIPAALKDNVPGANFAQVCWFAYKGDYRQAKAGFRMSIAKGYSQGRFLLGVTDWIMRAIELAKTRAGNEEKITKKLGKMTFYYGLRTANIRECDVVRRIAKTLADTIAEMSELDATANVLANQMGRNLESELQFLELAGSMINLTERWEGTTEGSPGENSSDRGIGAQILAMATEGDPSSLYIMGLVELSRGAMDKALRYLQISSMLGNNQAYALLEWQGHATRTVYPAQTSAPKKSLPVRQAPMTAEEAHIPNMGQILMGTAEKPISEAERIRNEIFNTYCFKWEQVLGEGGKFHMKGVGLRIRLR
ncbi:MAG: hypothetical protein LBF65_03440 [Holosporales bacterium]|jgi:hypothetical protein|nr:hypothetical protein [Holosporales bacterium]